MMFGHHDSNGSDAVQQNNQRVDTSQADALLSDTTSIANPPVPPAPTDTPVVPPVPPVPTTSVDSNSVSSAPIVSSTESATPSFITDSQNSVAVTPTPTPPSDDVPVTVTPVIPPAPAAVTDDLLNLKQTALSQLAPLVDHLDQTPDEKFRTTMMMIQANDNQALLKNAYDAAQAIPDEKTRAQALLDVVNEINYFTQKASDGDTENTTDSTEGAI